ncbi:Hint domain-containing protein [Gemmobacter serpentinus]|uniref:Hint domain-containing protein n=1 Tax=Gemmobacter serpentinus TaxID=2652247 RepID=UPI00384D45A9
MLAVGAAWRWTGVPVRVDGPQNVLILEAAEGAAELRRRAARIVRRLIGASLGRPRPAEAENDMAAADEPEQGFVVTDGLQSYAVTVIDVPDTGARLAMFVGDMPPEGRDMWIMRVAIDRTHRGAGARHAGGVICFTPDTRIATPAGPRLIQHLRPGDWVLTKDNGPQEILWTGQRRMSGARLYAMPHLRPVRFRAGALGTGQPDGDLLVSPQHRMVLRGPTARALFNSDEVLVAAEDLLNDRNILVDHTLREVTYIHLLLERHNILFANGMESESFHPANTALEMVEATQRESLLGLLPGIDVQPEAYGDYVRRNLSASEAAILRHDMAM